MGENPSKKTKTVILQNAVSPEDNSWIFKNVKIPTMPNNMPLKEGNKIPIKYITVTSMSIELRIEFQSPNRILSGDDPKKFIGISFANFRFESLPPKATADYIEKLLITGLQINSVKYIFYGHSNSQLKSRSCYLYSAFNGEELFKKINSFGDFSKISSLAKRAKRIGLLFSAAESQIKLNPQLTLDIDDVELNGHVFTDGCGLVSKIYASYIARQTKIIFHDKKYIPSVYQVRYRGYKGTVMVHPYLPKPHSIHFVKSMKKFTDCADYTFSVLDYSKPYAFGFLNGELVTLLSTLGIKDEVFLRKQKYYFDFLKRASFDPETAFMFLSYKGDNKTAEKVLLSGIDEKTRSTINRLKREEWKGSYDKRDKEKVRILIPLSRLLFGVSDYTQTLKEGEVHVRIKIEGMNDLTLDNVDVIVGRNPCLHPGDICKFRAVYKEELNHLVDCVVFPVVGERDAPSLMSGGDLDGDRFFVSWDKEIIPQIQYEPYGYPPAKEASRREITYESMVKYFAQYNNASLGKVKNLYLKWVAVSENKAGSKECQELNALFSNCVDGERINIPNHLQDPPALKDGERFILDLLCDEVKNQANSIFQSDQEVEAAISTPYELMENLLTFNCVCLSEFELFQLAYRWCLHNDYNVEGFLHCFNFGYFTLQEKHMVACQFKQSDVKEKYFHALFNGLHYSNLLSEQQLRRQNLHNGKIYWQKFYDSQDDDGLHLEVGITKALELFDRKLLVVRVDDDLTVAIYMAQKITLNEVLDIGKLKDNVKVLAFSSSDHTYRSQAERNYRIKFDGNVLQLYDLRLPNTFVWLGLQNENFNSKNKVHEPIRNKIRIERKGNSLHQNEKKINPSEFKVSIALQKLSGDLAKSRSRVTKLESKGIEIYVISNRDREGHQLLDLSFNQVDTTKVIKLEKNIPKEYNLVTDLSNISWTYRPFCEQFILHRDLVGKPGEGTGLQDLKDINQLEQLFFICQTLSDEDVGDEIFSYIVEFIITNFNSFSNKTEIWEMIFKHLHKFPKTSSLIVDKIHEWIFTNGSIENTITYPLKEYQCLFLVDGVIQTANSGKELTLKVFQKLIKIILHLKFLFSVKELILFLKSIVYSVRHTEIAEILLQELFNGETKIFQFAESSSSENEICFRYLKKFSLALALDYLGEVKDSCPCDFWGIPQGAEDTEDVKNDSNSKPVSFRKQVEKFVIADFMHQLLKAKTGSADPSNYVDVDVENFPFRGIKPKPAMKYLIIEPTDQLGFYKTILRIDIQNKIRNGDHLRFCASRRPVDNAKRRITVFNAIAESTKGGELIFEMKERQPRELFSASWNVYICTSTTTFNAMLVALRSLISCKEESTAAFRSILELPPKPLAMGLYFEKKETEIPAKKFNEMQTKAIKEAINSPLTLIWGPPGTGKTSVVVEILLQFVSLRAGLTILVAASTHNAVDNVLGRFLKERGERFGDNKSDDVVRITSDMEKVTIPELQKWTLNAFVGADIHTNDKAKRAALKRLHEARVVFSTCSGAGVGLLRLQEEENDRDDNEKKKKKQKEQTFEVVIVDEASQITEPNALIPLIKKSKYVILVGDHVQLRPSVSQIAKDCGLETTLFEKLYTSQVSNCVKVMLNVQYRMNPLLAKFPSKAFYEGKLLSGVKEEERVLPKSKFPWPVFGENENRTTSPLVFIDCTSPESYGTGSTSKMNGGQAKLTVEIIRDLLQSVPNNAQPLNYSITVLSPYTKQVTDIQSKLKAANLKADVKTIDSFQGRESDIIIYSTVRSNSHKSLGFLDDKRRMNVALTRARMGFILIGNSDTLNDNQLWNECIKSCTKIEYKIQSKCGQQNNARSRAGN